MKESEEESEGESEKSVITGKKMNPVMSECQSLQ